ncbi:MAG: PEP-CTERM sorting domain-containing protein [Opitutae bacterium]|nr:PEP-CTERM sorting domain-containing protein [Opitutae bacterium]
MNLPHAYRFFAGMFAIAALSAHAQIVQTNFGSETESLPGGVTLSTTDLLQTSLSSASRTGSAGSGNTYFYREDSGYTVDISRLYDGDFGSFGSTGLGGDGHYTVMPNNVTITFTFDLSTNTSGYDLSAIRTFASWDDGRDGQRYEVQYSTASAPSTFTSLYTIASYNPSFVTGDPANTVVQLTASSGSLATNVAALRFFFTGFENGGTAYREFDVVGAAAVPEPSTYAALVGLAALALVGLRRRQHATAGR